MSRFSGKCDLFDHIFSAASNWSEYFKAFEEFKQRTGGVLHQHHRIKEVNSFNRDFVAERNRNFKIVKIEKQIPDMRFANGVKTVDEYEYEYYGKRYAEKQLKKKGGVFIDVEIHFETVLDLIRYYPYIVSACYCGEGKEVVFISKESFVEEEFDDMLQYGHEAMRDCYNQLLAEHCREVCQQLDADLEKRKVIFAVESSKLKKADDGNYTLSVDRPISENHLVSWDFADGSAHSHWTSPRRISENEIVLHKDDVESYLKHEIDRGEARVTYVERSRLEVWPNGL